MPDIFAHITEADPAMLEIIAGVLETRAAIPQQQEMLASYLAELDFPEDARVLEVGCGTGPVARVLAGRPGVAQVVGIDPSPVLLDKARSLSEGLARLSYQEADGKALPFEDGGFDIVIIHTTLTHVPGPEAILQEAARVLKAGGGLGVCDGDFSTVTLSVGDCDPLQACAAAFVENFVNDRWLVRRLPALVAAAGFEVEPLRSYGLIETKDPGLTMTWVDRGADALVAAGRIGADLAAALKAEGRRRAAAGSFFGYMKYASLVAQKCG